MLGLPVLGSVSFASKSEAVIKGRFVLVGYIVTGGALFFAYLGVLYFQILITA